MIVGYVCLKEKGEKHFKCVCPMSCSLQFICSVLMVQNYFQSISMDLQVKKFANSKNTPSMTALWNFVPKCNSSDSLISLLVLLKETL